MFLLTYGASFLQYKDFVGDSPSGKASDSDSDTGGSNPSSPTNVESYRILTKVRITRYAIQSISPTPNQFIH